MDFTSNENNSPYPLYLSNFLSKLSGVKSTSNGWNSKCPCPDHGEDGDSHPSLSITVGDHGAILVYCQVGCSFWNIIAAMGLKSYQLRPHQANDAPYPTLISKPIPVDEDYSILKDKVYKRFLWHLKLSHDDKKGLKKRGFTDEEIIQGGYRTFTHHQSGEVLPKLLEEFGDSIYLVPGFIEEKIDDSIRAVVVPVDIAGLCIPVRDDRNRIVAIKSRRESEPKYIYLSSPSGSGRSSGSPVHFALPPLGTGYNRVRITEGELKADLATLRSETYTIGLPGVSNWWKALPLLKALNVQEVLISFDYPDLCSKKPVLEQALKFKDSLQALGFGVGIESWSGAKGIDDALIADEELKEHWGEKGEQLLTQLSNQLSGKSSSSHSQDLVVEPFPVEVFPPVLQEFISTVSSGLPCPPDFVAFPMLIVAGSVVGATRAIELLEGWEEMPSIYGCIVAPPASRKTPADKIVVRTPINDIQSSLDEIHQAQRKVWLHEMNEYKVKLGVYKAVLKEYFEAYPGGKKIDGTDAPPAPSAPESPGSEPVGETLDTSDTTIESLCQNLGTSLRGILVRHDELSAWRKGLNLYRGGNGIDLQYYLSFWSSAPITIHRKGAKDAIRVKKPFVSLFGWIQPDRVGELGDKEGKRDGLIDRFLFSIPKAETVPSLNKAGIPRSALEVWRRVIQGLRTLSWADDKLKRGKVLKLSSEASEFFHIWHEGHRSECLSPSFQSDLEGPYGKFPAYMGRLSLILHLLRQVLFDLSISNEPVSHDEVELIDVQGAAALIKYFKSHALACYKKMDWDSEHRRIKDLVKWMRAEKGGRATAREIYSSGRFKCRGSSDALGLMGKVIDRGLGFSLDEGKVKVLVLCQGEKTVIVEDSSVAPEIIDPFGDF